MGPRVLINGIRYKRASQACRGPPDRAADYRFARTGSAPLLVVATPLPEVREATGDAALLSPFEMRWGPRIVSFDQPPEFMTDVGGASRGPLPRHTR